MELTFNNSNFRYAFGTYDRVTIEGVPYRPTSHNEVGYVMTMTDETGLSQSFTHTRLSRLGTMGRIRHEPNFYRQGEAEKRLSTSGELISELRVKPRARLSRRSAFVNAFLSLEKNKMIKRTDKSIKENELILLGMALKFSSNPNPLFQTKIELSVDFREAPSPRTLRRWIKEAEALGDEGLVDAMHRRGNRGSNMDPEALRLMMREVRGYLSLEAPTIKVIYENVKNAFDCANDERAECGLPPLRAPSYETVRRTIDAIDPFEREVARKGLDAARKKFRPVGKGLELTRPLERVEMDECKIDLVSLLHSADLMSYLTDEERKAMGLDGSTARWMLSLALCCTTRCIVGMVLTPTATAEAAIQTLEMVMTNKGQWADSVGALGAWDMHGTPELIVTDCGSAYRSDNFRFTCADLGMPVERAIAGSPESRGRGERLFGSVFSGILPRLSGRTFSDIITKGDADPRERAALTTDDLIFALVRWVVDIYHNTPHRGLHGETPLQCWRRLTEQWGVQPPPDMRRRRMVFGRRLTRTLDKSGVTVLNVRYHSERLATWLNRKDKRKVEVRWHPSDIGAIEVRLGDEWFEIPAVEDGLDGVSAQKWLTTSRKLRASCPEQKAFDRKVIRKAIEAITERNSAAIATAGLLVQDWTPERIAREEKRNLISFANGATKKAKAHDGEVGYSIPEPMDYNPSDAVPSTRKATRSRNHKPGAKPASVRNSWIVKGEE
ncbi:Mu transposase C-terminal domain-containing protein [Pararhodobacter oceanensis]|uniref:Mu transposase C-terminal domain-containing protein n=1 Tax=Pararhodobacter oceanensis TaxID=2172121 RepID=UPI001F0B9C2C|nr:Mu transposase C-terminal domain-containing protein [Pararhodobacter oceanensis]